MDIVERLRNPEVFLTDGLISPVAETAAQEIERLREALHPFAKLAEALVDNKVNYAIGLTDDHFDAARKALREKE